MKNIETHGALRWGPVERKLQISYSPPPPKFAVVAEDSPVSLGSHALGSEMGAPWSGHPFCNPKKGETARRRTSSQCINATYGSVRGRSAMVVHTATVIRSSPKSIGSGRRGSTFRH